MDDILSISIEDFIVLIESQPVLWNKSLDDYKKKIPTQNAWREILLIMYPGFETWSEKKRQQYAKKTVKKWTHIRDTYMKSEKKIAGQKMYGEGSKIGKPYIYHKQLKFLRKNKQSSIQHLEATNKEDKFTDSESDSDTADVDSANHVDAITYIKEEAIPDDGTSSDSNDPSIQNNESHENSNTSKSSLRKRLSSNFTPIDTKMIKFMDSSRLEPINRHVSFFNAIIPTLDMFDDDQIIDFQLGVIQLLKNIKNQHKSTEIPKFITTD